MIAKYKSTKCIGNIIGGGHKRKTTVGADRLILRKITTNRRKLAASAEAELQTNLNTSISESTVSRRPHEAGLHDRVARKQTIH